MKDTVKLTTKARAEQATSSASAARARGSVAIARDVTAIRAAGNISQAALAEVFGWHRFAVSKIETGTNNIYLYDYLKMVHYMRDALPNHPAVALHDYLFKE